MSKFQTIKQADGQFYNVILLLCLVIAFNALVSELIIQDSIKDLPKKICHNETEIKAVDCINALDKNYFNNYTSYEYLDLNITRYENKPKIECIFKLTKEVCEII